MRENENGDRPGDHVRRPTASKAVLNEREELRMLTAMLVARHGPCRKLSGEPGRRLPRDGAQYV